MKLSFLIIAAVLVLFTTHSSSACDLLKKLPSKGVVAEIALEWYSGGVLKSTEQCSNGAYEITATAETFLLNNFMTGACGSDFSMHTRTAQVVFRNGQAFFYDLEGKIHSVDAVCTTDELRIKIPKSNLNPGLDPWMWGPSQWTFKLVGKSLQLVWQQFPAKNEYTQVSAKLQ